MVGLDGDALRPRPSIPAPLVAGLSFWLCCALSWQVSFALPVGGHWVLGATLAVAAIMLARGATRALKRIGRLACVAAAFACLGLCASLAASGQVLQLRENADNLQQASYTFTVLEEPSESYGSTIVDAQAWVLGQDTRVRLTFSGDDAPEYGQTFQAMVALSPPSESRLEGCNRAGVSLVGTVSGFQQTTRPAILEQIGTLRREMASAYDASTEGGMLMRALVFGDRDALLDSSLYQDVKVAGLAHLVAVSGAHLVVVCSFAAALLARTRMKLKASCLVQLCAMCFYLFLVGLPVSCLRAAVMSGASLIAGCFGKRNSSLSLLGVVMVLFVALDPSVSVSASFALSALATLGIVVFMPLFAGWVGRLPLSALVRDPLALTLAATLGTVPVSMALFAQFSCVAPLSNVLAAPAFTLLCALGMIAAVFYPVAGVGAFFAQVGSAVAELCCSAVHALACIPFACVPVDANLYVCGIVFALVAVLLWAAWPKPRTMDVLGCFGLVALVALCFAGTVASSVVDEVVMLDVGQGDAILVRSEGASVLIDTGTNDTQLLQGLARHGITHLDAVLISHPDDDHCGSLSALRGVVSVDKVVVARGLAEVEETKVQTLLAQAQDLTGTEPTYVSKGDGISIGRFACDVVSPESLKDEGGNADSVCLVARLDCDGDGKSDWETLFSGDAEADTLQGLVDEGYLEDIDVWKVSHHGAKASLTDGLAAMLPCKVALISVGASNRYGHPNPETLSRLASMGARVYRSDECGDVTLTYKREGISVATQR